MTPRLRLVGLALVAAGLWTLRGELVGDDLASPARPRPVSKAAPAAARADTPAVRVAADTRPALALREPLDDALRDPFSRPRQAVKATAPVAPAAVVAPPVAVAPSAPPPPPPRVPYRFIGLMSEGGRPTSVFLALGEQLLQARPGDLLEGGFQLKSIAARELVFTHPQLNLTVRMPVDGETS